MHGFFSRPAETVISEQLDPSKVRQVIADNLRFKQGIQQVQRDSLILNMESLKQEADLIWNPLQVDQTHYKDDFDSMEALDDTSSLASLGTSVFSHGVQHDSKRGSLLQYKTAPIKIADSRTSTIRTLDSDRDSLCNSSLDDLNIPVEFEDEPEADLRTCPRILTSAMVQQIHNALPESLHSQKWDRCFAIGRDGDSFITLLECCQDYRSTVLVIQTTEGHVLGGFVNTKWSSNKHYRYYGTGQCFLFASHPAEEDPVPTSNPLTIYKWTGGNDYCQICDNENQILAMGGEGDFGFVVRDCFLRGETGPCRTFGNPPLVPGFGGLFEIAALEIYGIVPLIQTYPSMRMSTSLMSTSPVQRPDISSIMLEKGVF
jgi:TLD